MSENDLTNEQGSAPDPLTMSDEEFASMDPSEFEQWDDPAGEEDPEQSTDEESGEAGSESSDDSTFGEEESDEEDTDSDDDAEEDDSDEEGDEEEADDEEDLDDDGSDEDSEDPDSEDDEADDEDTEDQEDEKDSDEVDYKAEYEKITAPFRANGREMQVKNADEAVKLMQMGANYNKKMAALKPSLKTVKLLDKHGLNEESKLSHLIDLAKGDKGAIQKLLKDNGVDPMDLDSDEENDYRPNTHTVDDRELELDEVLETLQDTPTYSKTVNLVSNEWDDASRQIIANNPRVLEVLNDQMANGVYERVSTEVDRLRAFGQLTGVSDIEAYKQVGDRMAEEGAFNDLAPNQERQHQKTEQEPPKRRTRRKKPDAKLKQKKRAASSTKTKPASKTPDDFNPLGMSDEDFEKQFDSKLL